MQHLPPECPSPPKFDAAGIARRRAWSRSRLGLLPIGGNDSLCKYGLRAHWSISIEQIRRSMGTERGSKMNAPLFPLVVATIFLLTGASSISLSQLVLFLRLSSARPFGVSSSSMKSMRLCGTLCAFNSSRGWIASNRLKCRQHDE